MQWQSIHPLVSLTIAYLRYIPNHFFKLRIVRSLLKLFSPQGIIVKNPLGAKLSLDFDDYIAWSIINTGFYEGKSIELASSLLKNGGVFLDIGANFGLWTCALGALPNVQCVSIEPFAINFLHLQQNLSLNPSIQCKLFNIALANFEGIIEMECNNNRNLGTARVVLSDNNPSALTHAVSTTTLKSLLKFSGVGAITLMKIDVEGYELPILKGLDWDSHLRPQHIIIEFVEFTDSLVSSQGQGRKGILDFLVSHGYQGQTIDGKDLNLDESCLEGNAYFRDIQVAQNG
jgi:FkbM family methyltransferase